MSLSSCKNSATSNPATMSFPESLRAYADWCEKHPDLQKNGMIDLFGETAFQAKDILLADNKAKLDLLRPTDQIVYLDQYFGCLAVRHVLRKSDICVLSVENNEVVSALKPEFAELVRS